MPGKKKTGGVKKKLAERGKKQRAKERRTFDARAERREKKQKEREREKRRRERQKQRAREAAAPPVDYDGNPNEIDIRVGLVVSVEAHEQAERLLVEKINVGDPSGLPRTICSGLRGKIAPEDLQGKQVLVMCNLRPRDMVGVQSNGMVLVAHEHDEDGEEVVSLLEIPEDCYPGERILFEGCERPRVSTVIKPKKLKLFLPFFKSGDDRMCGWKDFKMKSEVTESRITTRHPNSGVS